MTTLGVKVASNSLLPPDVGGAFNQASWTAGAADALANGIIQQAFANNGDTSKIGMPASWPYGPIPSGAVRADGTISPLLWSQIQGYANSSAAQSDQDFGGWLGVQYSQAAPGGLTDAPLTAAEQLARDKFEFDKTQQILSMIGGARGSTSSGSATRSTSSRVSSSGGGGGGGSSGRSLEEQQAADAQSLATYQAKRDIDLAYQQALNALQSDPNNPEYAYRAAQLAETKRQFDEQMAYNRERDAKSIGLDTAKIIADYSANPGDAVAREYFLRGQAQPVGNAVNIFTGQPTGQQMTLSEVMRANAPLVGAALNGALTGQPVEAQQNAQQVAQQSAPAPEAPQDDRTPAYADGTDRLNAPPPTGNPMTPPMQMPTGTGGDRGPYPPPATTTFAPPVSPPQSPNYQPERSRQYVPPPSHGDTFAPPANRPPEITPDGWTRSDQFITGDHPAGMPNPELNQVRVRNGRAETKVTPLSRMLFRPHGVPFTGEMPATSSRPAPFGVRKPRRTPMYADGTDPWAWMGTDWNQADNFDGFGNTLTDFGSLYNPDNLAQPQSGAYQPSTATSPVYSSTGQSNITFGSAKDPYAVQTNSGVPYNVSMAAADPFFGTSYQGMDPNAVVTNANSPYYGMTAQAAFDATVRHDSALTAGYGSGALDALGQVNNQYAPAYVVGPTADIPGLYYESGAPRPTINVNNQADAGILTGAQMQSGVTQSTNPGLPGYVRPNDLPPLPGSQPTMGVTTSTDTTQGGTQTDSVRPATTSTTSGAAGGPTNEPTGVSQPTQPAVTATGVNLGTADAGGNQLVMGAGVVSKDGATWQLQSGDYRRPDGTWVRYDPVRKEYMPIQPNYTPITSEAEFWKLPADVQQKILTGQPTGYALLGDWRSGLLAGLQSQLGGNGAQPMSDEAFRALPADQQLQLLENPPQQMGSYQPGQYLTRQDLGPAMGSTDGLLRLPMGGPTSSFVDYSPALSEDELNNLYSSFTQESGVAAPNGTLMKPWDVLTTPIEEKPDSSWQIYTRSGQIGNSPVTIAISPTGATYQGEDGIWHKTGMDWHTAFGGTANPFTSPDQLSTWLAENHFRVDNSYASPAPVSGPGQGDAPAPSSGGTTTGTGIDFRDPATLNAPPPGTTTGGATSGANGGSTGVERGGSTTGGTTSGGSTTGGTTGGSTQGNPLAQALAQLLGLSYGSDAYQNLPSLLFAGGGDAGNYDTVSNQPIEVPGLGITLPSASQMMNYEMLNKLQQNGSFDLLNSLYTAGNVPLSILLKMAEARAPRGSAYEPGLVSTV